VHLRSRHHDPSCRLQDRELSYPFSLQNEMKVPGPQLNGLLFYLSRRKVLTKKVQGNSHNLLNCHSICCRVGMAKAHVEVNLRLLNVEIFFIALLQPLWVFNFTRKQKKTSAQQKRKSLHNPNESASSSYLSTIDHTRIFCMLLESVR